MNPYPPPTPTSLQQALLLVSRGDALQQAGHVQQAAEAYRQAVNACPGSVSGYLALLNLLLVIGDLDNAERVVQATPAELGRQSPPFRFRQARLRLQQQRHADALALLQGLQGNAAVDQAQLFFNLGIAHNFLGHFSEACHCYEKAHGLGLRHSWLYGNWARASQVLGDIATAERLYREASRKFPGDHGLRYEQALFLLKCGNFPLGFQLYRNRWQTGLDSFANHPRQLSGLPLWEGKDSAARVLVTHEQGIGDQIVFTGLIPALMRRTGAVGLALDPRLAPLLARTWPGLAIEPPVTGPVDFGGRYDAALSVADLGLVVPEGIGWPDGGLVPDHVRAATIRERYRSRFPGKRLVGISWMSKNSTYSAAKSIDLMAWLPLLQQPDTCFINLQYGDVSAELERLRVATGISIHQDPDIDPFHDLDGLASQMAALDLVITSSNSTAHLALATGALTWVIVPRGTGLLWYWGYAGTRCPWYPAARLFRTDREGDWTAAITDVKNALQQYGTPP